MATSNILLLDRAHIALEGMDALVSYIARERGTAVSLVVTRKAHSKAEAAANLLTFHYNVLYFCRYNCNLQQEIKRNLGQVKIKL